MKSYCLGVKVSTRVCWMMQGVLRQPRSHIATMMSSKNSVRSCGSISSDTLVVSTLITQHVNDIL